MANPTLAEGEKHSRCAGTSTASDESVSDSGPARCSST